jgi:anti-sigma regulatory factor (Ser/Thr protein kinase)
MIAPNPFVSNDLNDLMDMPGVHRLEYRLTMAPDLACLPRVIAWLMRTSVPMCPEMLQLHVRGALHELLFNAVEHGSLELFSENKRKALDEDRYDELLEQRRNDPRYKDRKVVIDVVCDRDSRVSTYRITDEGKGFDWRRTVGRSQDFGGEDAGGRGIFLVRSLFPSLTYNDRGNEVTFTVPLG